MQSIESRLVSAGLSVWEKSGQRRIYINHLDDLARAFPNLSIHFYKTGNISSASYNQEKISNSNASKLLGYHSMYFDCIACEWVNVTQIAQEILGKDLNRSEK